MKDNEKHNMNLTATHINYYMVCKRKLWLFSNGINMEHTSDAIAIHNGWYLLFRFGKKQKKPPTGSFL